jgi:ADP-ribosyl-[dinitrogen reductase] hydrolase
MIEAFRVLYFATIRTLPPGTETKAVELAATLLDKFKGTLIGCAVGDALGMPVEGLGRDDIARKYGSVTDFIDERFGAGRVTDDTQMTVTLAQSIIELGKFDKGHAGFKFGRWIDASDRGVKEARGAGEACETASRRLFEGVSHDESGLTSAGCGAAMRAAPIGLRYYADRVSLYRCSVDQALITHTDPGAVAGSAAMAFAVAAGIGDGGDLDRSRLAAAVGAYVSRIDSAMSSKIAGLADYLDASPEEGFAYTGTGCVAVETVPGALFAFLRSPYDIEETIVAAVNAGGDTDSLGAMAGAVAGAFNGASAIPERWKNGVEGRDYLESIAYRLYTLTPAWKPRSRPLV